MQCVLTSDEVRYRTRQLLKNAELINATTTRGMQRAKQWTTPETVIITWEPNQGTYHADAGRPAWTLDTMVLPAHPIIDWYCGRLRLSYHRGR